MKGGSALQELILGHPKVVGIVGLVLALLFGALAVSSFLEMQRLPTSPQRVSMSEASALAPTSYSQRPWVVLALSLYPLCLWMRKKLEAEHAELLSKDRTT